MVRSDPAGWNIPSKRTGRPVVALAKPPAEEKDDHPLKEEKKADEKKRSE